MNTADILRGLWRRWYITIPGILLSIALAFMMWSTVDPSYQRSARQLLLPGTTSIPEGGNPYLYIGGLSQAADVVVLALGSNNVLDTIAEEHPEVAVEISRDTSTSSPVIVITVTAADDSEGEAVLGTLVDETADILADLQDQESIASDNRITVHTVTVDGQSVLEQKDRMTTTAAAGAIGVVLTLVLAAAVDGLIISRRRRRSRSVKPRRGDAEDTAPDVRRRSAADEPDDDVADADSLDDETRPDDSPDDLADDEASDEEIRNVLADEHLAVSARPRPSTKTKAKARSASDGTSDAD